MINLFLLLSLNAFCTDELTLQESIYTLELKNLAQTWISTRKDPWTTTERSPAFNSNAIVKVELIRTKDQEYYIGLKRQTEINASLENVSLVMEDFEKYHEIKDGIKRVHVVSRTENTVVTEWERKIPVFFLPNIHYELVYFINASIPGVRIYRNQLKKSGKLKFSDSLVFLEAVGQKTHYTAFDFYEANWGPVKILGAEKIWKDSIKGSTIDALLFKLKSEHLAWNADKVHNEAIKLLGER